MIDKRKKKNLVEQLIKIMGVSKSDAEQALWESHYDLKTAQDYLRRHTLMRQIIEPDYRAFARDLLRLCKKYGIRGLASNEGNVFLGPANGKYGRDFPYSFFSFNPREVTIGDHEENPIIMTTE